MPSRSPPTRAPGSSRSATSARSTPSPRAERAARRALRVPYIADLDEALARQRLTPAASAPRRNGAGGSPSSAPRQASTSISTSRWSRSSKKPTLSLQPVRQQACAATCSA